MGLSDRQRKFVDNFIDGMSPVEAAREAGYKDSTASNPGQNILSSESVQKAIKRKQSRNLLTLQNRLESLADPAMKELEEMINSEAVKPKTKLSAIKTVLDRIEELEEKVGVDLGGEIDHEHKFNLDNVEDEEKDDLIKIVSKMMSE